MLVRNGCKVVVLCALTTAAIAVGSAQTARSNSTNEALTFNGDGAQRSNQIHWPDGFHPEQADLFAHNEIFVHASCKKVFTNLADAQEGARRNWLSGEATGCHARGTRPLAEYPQATL
jgi:hypothetical protein